MAQANGMVRVHPQNGAGFTSQELDVLLSTRGPLWVARGFGHVVVLTGINDAVTTFNDPMLNGELNGTLAGFNQDLVAGYYMNPFQGFR